MPTKKDDPGQRSVRQVTYIFEDEAEALDARARQERISKSEIIRRAIRSYLGMD